jgi:DNA-binding MarR family transcriptional regulator
MLEKLKLENQLCFKFYDISKKIIKLYKPILEKVDLSYTQYLVMLVLWENKEMDFKTLGEKVNLKTGTLTPLLKKMENAGLLNRIRKEDDERKVNIKITQKGIELQKKAEDIPDCILKSMNLSLEEYEILMNTLNKLSSKFE